MNIAAMDVLTGVIFAEKMLPFGARVAQVLGVALVLYGIFVLAVPTTL